MEKTQESEVICELAKLVKQSMALIRANNQKIEDMSQLLEVLLKKMEKR